MLLKNNEKILYEDNDLSLDKINKFLSDNLNE